ncbi:hypothetical protein HDE78_004107 [Rhodanobacter sp. K2T2]|nr:hypothetical protein [Rhodanobacter sp. K2T2]
MEVFDGNASAVHAGVPTRSSRVAGADGFRERGLALSTVEI